MKQVIVFFIDGTDMPIAGFDKRRKHESYAVVLACIIHKKITNQYNVL